MAELETFQIHLPPDLVSYVRAEVGHGALASESDVLRDAVRQAAEWRQLRDSANRKIAEGVRSLQAGKGVDGEAFMEALDGELSAHERRGI